MRDSNLGTRARLGGYLFVSLLVAGFGLGCGLFEIRNPVPPNTDILCVEVLPTNPEDVLVNFAAAMSCKLDGVSQFQDTWDQEEVGAWLVLDPLDAAALGQIGIENPDSLTFERIFTGHFALMQEFDVTDSVSFEFGDAAFEEITDQTAFYQDIPYFMTVLDDTLGVTQRIEAVTNIALRLKSNQEWVITRWGQESRTATQGSTTLGFEYGSRSS